MRSPRPALALLVVLAAAAPVGSRLEGTPPGTPAASSEKEKKTVTSTEKKDRVVKTNDEWRKQLTPQQYQVTREKGTERAFTGAYAEHHEDGVYSCVCCGLPLFDSKTKFDSGTGWPSYWAPIEGSCETETDRGFFMTRVEVHCRRCDAHLGHVFEDGPKPTGLRYCINSASLTFQKRK